MEWDKSCAVIQLRKDFDCKIKASRNFKSIKRPAEISQLNVLILFVLSRLREKGYLNRNFLKAKKCFEMSFVILSTEWSWNKKKNTHA